MNDLDTICAPDCTCTWCLLCILHGDPSPHHRARTEGLTMTEALTRLIAACHDVANAGGPAMRTQAITRVREYARQLDQEEPCPNPSTSNSSTTSTTSEPNSQTTQTTSAHGSPATSTRTRTIKPTPAQSRRRTP